MKWIIPNSGPVVLILGNDEDSLTDKANLLLALECAAKAGQLRGDLDRFMALLKSQIELEAALAKEAA